ncbi:glycosyltransferase family 2 protein [Clostridium tarantellae]|uniref:Glycosyltransferase n=1 Tax=Clostridium tarantellae TaxID=39493 RepID=A0A6I1MP06_9CLOT|nr:glycosyltransferase family 2 protein [Clostridium tarantellae]MPQ44208.1 glycosyltransferase [Clostridium tarantellae]
MIDISVIVPVYNIEDYIDKCIKSIQNQDLHNIEIIIINDGSKDKSIKVIKELAKEDNRIIIIDKKNEGVSVARNCGLKLAKGKYVLFVDGDDWLKENCLKTLYTIAERNNLDILNFDFIETYYNGRSTEINGTYFDNINKSEYIKKCLLNQVSAAVWGKLIRKNILEKNNLKFNENLSYGEDMLMSIKLAIFSNRISKINKKYYYYYQRTDSTIHSLNKKVYDVSKAVEEIKKMLYKNNLMNEYKEEYEFFNYIHNYFYRVITTYPSNEIHFDLNKLWKEQNITIKNNKFYNRFYNELANTTKLKIKLYDLNYNIGKVYSIFIEKLKR